MPRRRKSETPQVEDLINAARVPVFLLDDHQIIRRDEVGSVDLIVEAAERMGCGYEVVKLEESFRCGGSKAYIDWIDELFGFEGGGPRPWRPLDDYDLHLAPTPRAMEAHLRGLRREGPAEEEKIVSRIAAGYCRPWTKEPVGGRLAADVDLDGWARPWNADAAIGRKADLDYVPPTSMWTTHPNAFEQIGCIYTAQGFEYDHAGVIIGPDLVWGDSGTWRTAKERNKDVAVNGAKDADPLIRAIYRVLATRGMRSTVLYSVDPRTRDALEALGIPMLPEPPSA